MKRRILVVDDETQIQEVIQACLEILYGWEVYVASSGPEALDRAQQHQPDVILLDVSMPEMDGLATLHKLQSNPSTTKIPVILLTAKAQPLDQSNTEPEIAGLIAKPFEPLKLAEQITAILECKNREGHT